MVAGIGDVRALYEAYRAQVQARIRESSPGDGLLGMGGGIRSDPCHDRFAAQLEELLHAIRAREPDSREVREILEFIYSAPLEGAPPEAVYWMELAVHGLTTELVALLSPRDAAALRERYARAYRPWERLPSQKKALAALDRAAKRPAGDA